MQKSLLKKIALLFLGILFINAGQNSGKLVLVVNGITTNKGTIRIAIYNSAQNFLDEKKYNFTQSTPANNNKSVELSFDIPYGTYAISCYHDINDNYILDKSTWGYPVEPYALSIKNDIKWRKPTFNETKFQFQSGSQKLFLELKLWKER